MTLPIMIPTVLSAVAFGFLGTLGFAILFSVPRRALLLSAAVGALGAGLRAAGLGMGGSAELATFVASLTVGLVGYGAAYVVRAPRLVYTVPGVISMVPGIPAYEVVVLFSTGRYIDGLIALIRVAFLLAAIGGGLSTARILTDYGARRTMGE